jgi:carbon storage regulator
MLVLSRKVYERIFIGKDIVITLVEVYPGGGKAKIGIEAPDGLLILREELKKDIEEGRADGEYEKIRKRVERDKK